MGTDEYFEAITTIRLDMLELIGRGYAIEHCVSFFNKKREEQRYKYYLTDAIRILTYNTSMKGRGVIEQRYYDLAQKINQKEDNRTADDVIDNISDKLRKMSED